MTARAKKKKARGKRSARCETRWKPGSQVIIDPIIARRRYDSLRQRHGKVTAKVILDDARKRSSPFHSHFVWDDTVAAEKYRMQQARYLLGSLEVMIEYSHSDGKKPKTTKTAFVRYLHAVGPVGEAKSGLPYGSALNDYAPVTGIASTRATRAIMIRDAHRELLVWKKKYEHLKKFVRVCDAIDLLDLE